MDRFLGGENDQNENQDDVPLGHVDAPPAARQ